MQYSAFYGCKNDDFQMENSDIFSIFDQNIDSNEYLQFMFYISAKKEKKRKLNVYFCKPQFFYSNVGIRGCLNNMGVFAWWTFTSQIYNFSVGLDFLLRPLILRVTR